MAILYSLSSGASVVGRMKLAKIIVVAMLDKNLIAAIPVSQISGFCTWSGAEISGVQFESRV